MIPDEAAFLGAVEDADAKGPRRGWCSTNGPPQPRATRSRRAAVGAADSHGWVHGPPRCLGAPGSPSCACDQGGVIMGRC